MPAPAPASARAGAEAVASALPPARWPETVSRHDWHVVPMARRYPLRDREDGRLVHSVIDEVECLVLNACRRELAAIASTPLSDTLPQVTLFVAGTSKGIGLA